jgi:RNA polymerase sigma factor (sigma-70 family)
VSQEQTPFDAAVLEAERPRLLALAYSIVVDRADAADVVQDTMEQAIRSGAMIRDAERGGAWLSTICVRRALRRARAQRVSHRFLWGRSAEPRYFMQTSDLDLEKALARLSDKQRAVIALHYVYGYTLDESAEVLGCRPGTVRSHLSRGLRSLREALTP